MSTQAIELLEKIRTLCGQAMIDHPQGGLGTVYVEIRTLAGKAANSLRAEQALEQGSTPLSQVPATVEAITLQGEQSDPTGYITVTVKMSDGRDVELIRTCANSIYHMVTMKDPVLAANNDGN